MGTEYRLKIICIQIIWNMKILNSSDHMFYCQKCVHWKIKNKNDLNHLGWVWDIWVSSLKLLKCTIKSLLLSSQ